MAKKKENAGRPTAVTVLEDARVGLAGKGYRGGNEHSYAEGKAWLFQANGKPGMLLCAVDPDKAIDEHQGQLAVLTAAEFRGHHT